MNGDKKTKPTGRKGGTSFPRIDLETSVKYAEKLVAKTHTGPQPKDIVYPGVFGVSGTEGNVRAAALRHYGLLSGGRDDFVATELAKNLVAAPPEEREQLLRRAVILPKVFGVLYSTFRGDVVSQAKMKQQAANQGVHPDHIETCAKLFLDSLIYAGIAQEVEGGLHQISQLEIDAGKDLSGDIDNGTEVVIPEDSEEIDEEDQKILTTESDTHVNAIQGSARSVIQVNVTIDSSMDTEKLHRQLSLLRKFGAI